jgi:hypothetical protein
LIFKNRTKTTDHTTRQTINQALSIPKGLRLALFAFIGSLFLLSLRGYGDDDDDSLESKCSKVRAEQIEGTEVMIS